MGMDLLEWGNLSFQLIWNFIRSREVFDFNMLIFLVKVIAMIAIIIEWHGVKYSNPNLKGERNGVDDWGLRSEFWNLFFF